MPTTLKHSPALLAEIGEALYGIQWRSALARDLEVAMQTVWRWDHGSNPVPAWAWARLAVVTRHRAELLAGLYNRLSGFEEALKNERAVG